MIELGHFAAFLALGATLAQTIFGLKGDRRWAGMAAVTGFGLMAFSFLTLVYAFAVSDFSLQLVANNSHTLKPMLYKVAGTWGNHEGSMALWALVTLAFGAAAAALSDGAPRLFLLAGRTCDAPRLFASAIKQGATHVYVEKPGAESAELLEGMRALANERTNSCVRAGARGRCRVWRTMRAGVLSST